MIRIIGLLVFFTLSASLAVAQTSSSNFTINQRIISDITPPTIPGVPTFTFVAHNQIDLTWAASTDNQVLSGYQLFRDGTAIATTTLTSFTDTGVSPSTTYSYYVQAFDHIFNYSTTSASAATTTLEAPPVPPTPTSTSITSTRVPSEIFLTDLVVEPDLTSAFLSWQTNGVVRYELRWGTTDTYELGFVTSQVFGKSHQTVITELDPNTIYQYELIAYRRSGERIVLSQDKFKTLTPPDSVVPANVSNFRAEARGEDVMLTWNNPDEDFSYVRIVRNPSFYPTDPNNGFIVYQGPAEWFFDEGVLPTDGVVYYTAFTYDASGNRSSGAITFAAHEQISFTPPGITRPSTPVTTPGVAPTTPTTTEADPGTEGELLLPTRISLADVSIIQDGVVIESVSDTFLVDTTRPFTISAPVDLFPRHLKIIQVTLFHPVDDTIFSSFLLRINAARTAYETTINGLDYFGSIPLHFTVFDYNINASATSTGYINSLVQESDTAIIESIGGGIGYWYWWWIPTLLILYLWLRAAFRRGGDAVNIAVRSH